MKPSDDRIRDAIRGLLRKRVPPATICPSEVAREVDPQKWRSLMPQVREVAIALATAGEVEIRQRGSVVDASEPLRGPIRIGLAASGAPGYPRTPDGRYFVVRGRLWRLANPQLPAEVRDKLVRELMDARRGLRGQPGANERKALRNEIDRVKRELGERGPVWWTDGAPDDNRKLVKNTPYAAWFAKLDPEP